MADRGSTLNPYVGVRILRPQPDMCGVSQTHVATMVDWAFSPDWLTVQEAARLSGHTREIVRWLIQDGAVDTKRDGDAWLIEKASLYEFQETLAEVLHWSA